MSGLKDPPDTPGKWGVTLNDLRDRQYFLNMQMLLAIQIHDGAAQKRLKGQLAELQERIDQITTPGRRRGSSSYRKKTE